MIQVLAVAHFCKGERLLSTFRDLGCQIVLLSRAKMQDQPWPRHLVEEVFFVRDFRDRRDVMNAVSYLNQDRRFHLVAPMDEYAVGTAAYLRAHLACPGLCEGTTRKVRDKLTMRCVADTHGIPVPRFSGFNNREEIASLLQSTEPPWMVKPRSAGGAVRIQKLLTTYDVWQAYDELGDRRSHHLIEEFVPSEVYHVDTIVTEGKIGLEVAGRYATPPFDVWHGGGVFGATTVPRKSKLCKELLALNARVLQAMGVRNGVNHAEYLYRDGKLYFLEIAARVPGSNLDLLTTAATGVDLYVESAKIQFASVTDKPYKLPKFHYQEAAIVQCLAHQQEPDLGEIARIPELCWKLQKDYHVGAAFSSPSAARIDDILAQVLDRFAHDHLAVLPASQSPA